MKNFAYKFRIYPTKKQEEYFNNCFRARNFIYNYFLNEQIQYDNMLRMYGLPFHKERKEFKLNLAKQDVENKKKAKENNTPFYKDSLYFDDFEASVELTKLSKTKFLFLKDIDSTMRSTTLNNLKDAFSNISKINSGFPKFKNNKKNKSFTGQILYNGKDFPANFKFGEFKPNSNFGVIKTLPKIKNLKCVIHQDLFKAYWNDKNTIKINSYTISQNVQGQYFISLNVENKKHVQIEQKEIEEETSIGIDMGVERPITTSDPDDFNNPVFSQKFNLIKSCQHEIKRLNQIISQKMERNPNWKNSNKYKRLRKKLNKLHTKISNKRNNIQHNITKELANKENVNTFILEDLQIKNMTKKAKNKGVKAKSGLNRVMLDVGIHSIQQKLTYKLKEKGKNIEFVKAQNTSITCSKCGYCNKKNRQTQSLFQCIKCNHTENADFNAGKNIKNKFFKNFHN